TDLGLGIRKMSNYTITDSVGLTRRLTKRTTFTADAGQRTVKFVDPQWDFSTWGVHASLQHQLTKRLGAQVGYARERGETEETGTNQLQPGGTMVNETIDVGLDFGSGGKLGGWTFGFSTGTSRAQQPGQIPRYLFSGNANLARTLYHTW